MNARIENGTYAAKPWQYMLDTGYKFDTEGIDCGDAYWTSVMEERCPESRIIEVIDGVWTDNSGYEWEITPDMLMGPALKYNEPCQARDSDDEPWEDAIFHGYRYNPDAEYHVETKGNLYSRVRRIPEKKSPAEEYADSHAELYGHPHSHADVHGHAHGH